MEGHMKITALIMAGGKGERFWPKSRTNTPKQFLHLADNELSMIQLTKARISALVPNEDIYIVTNKNYKTLVLEQLPDIPKENILCEPVGRNTAPCIGLGALYILNKYDDALMIVLPSDHLIKFSDLYINALKDACEVAAHHDNLVTIGITPDYPETGYGYIKFNSKVTEGRAFCVERFVEKPRLANAKEYLSSEEYLWNSGTFVWKISSIMKRFAELLPETYIHLQNIRNAIAEKNEQDVLEKEFSLMDSVSIDYGIMEKANDIFVVPGTFGWDDVGSWLAVSRIKKSNDEGNVVEGDVITISTQNNVILGSNRLIAMVGMENTVVVDTNDAILICAKDSTSEIKKVLETLKICNRNNLI